MATDLRQNLEGVRNLSNDGKGLSRSLITMNKRRTILSRWNRKSTAGRRQFFTVRWLRSSFPMITADSLDGLMVNPHPSWLKKFLNGRLRRCWATENAMARPSFLSNGKDTPTVIRVGNRWNVTKMRWIWYRPGGLTTCLEMSFLSRADSLQGPRPRRQLAGPVSRTKDQLILTFSSRISKVSMRTLDLRIAELLRVGYMLSLIDRKRCFVSGV